MHYFDVIDDTISDSSKGEKGEITTVVTNTIEFTVGGFRRNIQRFMEDHPGGRFLIIYQMNDDESYYIIGTALKPMLFKSFERLNKDSRSVKMTFENKSFQQPQKVQSFVMNRQYWKLTLQFLRCCQTRINTRQVQILQKRN